jgi:hypothetical protein
MPNLLHFPSRFFANAPGTRAFFSAAQTTSLRPSPGPHLVIAAARPISLLASGDERSPSEHWIVVSRLDLALARGSKQGRLRRIFTPADYPDPWPLGAA